MGDGVGGWDGVVLLLDINVGGWVLNDEWHFLGDGVLLEFPDGEFSDVGDFVWHLNLGRVVLPKFDDEWLINGHSEEGLVPLSLLEFVLDGEWFFLVLGHWNLLRYDVWYLLDDGVVHSLGDFVWNGEFVLIRDLVVDCVWDLLGGHIWDLVDDGVRHFSAGGIWDLDLNFVWDLSFDGVWDLL